MQESRPHTETLPGREEELQRLYRRCLAAGSPAAESLLLAGDLGMGKTALLRQLGLQLFWKQERVVPFRYSVNSALLEMLDFSRDYLRAFLRQRLAFDERDQALLRREDVSLTELAGRAESMGHAWAGEIARRVLRPAEDPLELFTAVLQAPASSASATGKPVAVLVDDAAALAGLNRAGRVHADALALFSGPAGDLNTVHILADRAALVRESALPVLAETELQPLLPADAGRVFAAMLPPGAASDSIPASLLGHLAGNPLYLRQVASAVKRGAGEEDFWSAYYEEIVNGRLHRILAAEFKRFFPAETERRHALEVIRRVYASGASSPLPWPVQVFVEEKLSPAAVHGLVISGFVCGGFGGYRPPEDRVLRDFINLLFEREITRRTPGEILQRALAGRTGADPLCRAWEWTLPLEPRAELVAAESLQQIGRNLQVPEETIGQLQMAMIEACINAIEHTKGGDGRMHVSLKTFPDRWEVAVESAGLAFVQAETGEPMTGIETREGAPRGQGIRLMKRFADAVRFEPGSRGTRVVLVKNLSVSAHPAKEDMAHRE